jgi:hypothetical protein
MDSASIMKNLTFQIFWEGTWMLLLACLDGTHAGCQDCFILSVSLCLR